MRGWPAEARRLAVRGAVLLVLLAAAQPARAAGLAERVEAFVSKGALKKARVGVRVVALPTGRAIYSRNETYPFIAASNEKLVTAVAALEVLGPAYEFETTVHAEGELAGGVLRGDLVLRGGGDPTIGGRYDAEGAMAIFERWARVLKARGLRRVTGGVVADDTLFDRIYRHPRWTDYPAWKWHYTTTSALSVNDNCVDVIVRPGSAPGAPARVSMEPASAPLELQSTCKTSSKRHAIWFDRRAGETAIKVGGYVRHKSAGYRHGVAVPDPPLYAAAALREALSEAGMGVDGPARAVALKEPPAPGEPLLVRRMALRPVLEKMLRRSHNHYAEQVVKTVGAESGGVGSWESGLGRAGRVLRGIGIEPGQFELDDGSGLSRRNRLSPLAVTILLEKVRHRPYGDEFVAMLPVAGRDGTLRSRLTEAPYAGNVRAKTGYLNGVGALSGYARTRSGVEVAFCILVNDSENPPGTYSMRETVDGLCRLVVDHAG
jgi:D-alanyl-D-alanine carboxypeptidase/D-alanyl-D-alanine-endopeptidase (penicillin-binding protein 4)